MHYVIPAPIQVLPDFKNTNMVCPALLPGDAHPADFAAQQWFDSAVRRFLGHADGDMLGRPPQRQLARRSSLWWLKAVNHALVLFTGQGLERFASEQTPGIEEGSVCPHPASGIAPALVIGSDEHSVGLAAMAFACHHLHLRVAAAHDASHRVNNDLMQGLKSSGPWWKVVLLMSIPYKINYGPWLGSAFFRQLQEVGLQFMSENSSSCALFQGFLPKIAHDVGKGPDAVGDPQFVQDAWAGLGSSKVQDSKGPKMQFARWGAWFDSAEYWDSVWHQRLLIMTVWGVSSGVLTGKASDMKLQLQPIRKPAQDSDSKETMRQANMTGGSIGSLRDKCKNQLHCALVILGMPQMQRMTRIIMITCRSLRLWLGLQAQGSRSAVQNWSFIATQSSFRCCEPLIENFALLRQVGTLQVCGFYLMQGSHFPEGHLAYEEEAEWMQMWFKLVCEINGHRLKSALWYVEGLPGVLAGLLAEDTKHVHRTLAWLQEAWACFKVAQTIEFPDVQDQVLASPFSTQLVARLMALLEAASFKSISPMVLEALKDMFSFTNTKVVEDLFHNCRQAEDRGSQNSAASPEHCWFVGYQSQVLSRLHHYNEVNHELCTAAEAVQEQVSKARPELYNPRTDIEKLPLHLISKDKDPAWPTYNAQSKAAAYGNVQLWMHCCQHPGDWGSLGSSWMCSLLAPATLARKKGTSDKWFFALRQVERKAALVWPAESLVTDSVRYYRPLLKERDEQPYVWVVVLDPNEFEAQQLIWETPLSCRSRPGGASSSSSSPSMQQQGFLGWGRASGEPIPLLECAAMDAFSQLNMGQISELVRLLKVDVRGNATFFQKFYALLKHALPNADEERLQQLLAKRGLSDAYMSEVDTSFWELDEVKDTFGPGDASLLEGEVKDSRRKQTELKEFKEELSQHVASRRRATTDAPPGKGRGRGRGRPKSVVSVSTEPAPKRRRYEKPKPNAEVTEEDVQDSLPPGFKAWKDTFCSRFQVRHPVCGTLSRSWQLHGSMGSAMQVLAWAWDQHSVVLGCIEPERPHWLAGIDWQV